MKKKVDKFDWESFYCEGNACIIQNLLDKQYVSIGEVVQSLFPRTGIFYSDIVELKNILYEIMLSFREGLHYISGCFINLYINCFSVKTEKKDSSIVIDFINQKFKDWLDRLKNGAITFDPFKQVLALTEEIKKNNLWTEGYRLSEAEIQKLLREYSKPVTSSTLINSDYILKTLIESNLLPFEILRLPRLPEQAVTFKPIPTYYEEILIPYNSNRKELMKISPYYSEIEPVTYTYEELTNLLKENKLPRSKLLVWIKENLLGAYLRVIDPSVTEVSQNLCKGFEYLQRMNCGNSFYNTRYKGLERLPLIDENSGFSISDFFTIESFKMDIRNHRWLKLQTTDFEMKFHIERHLKSFNGKSEIKINDLVFLKEEVNRLGLKEVGPTLSTDLQKNQNEEKLCKFIEETGKRINKLAIKFDSTNLPFNKKQLLEFFNNKSARQNVQNLPAYTRHTLNKFWKKLPYRCKPGYIAKNILFELFPEVKN